MPALAGKDVFRVGDRTSFLLAASLLFEDDVLTLFVAQSFTVSAEVVFEDVGGHGYIPRIVGFHGGDHLAGRADVFGQRGDDPVTLAGYRMFLLVDEFSLLIAGLSPMNLFLSSE